MNPLLHAVQEGIVPTLVIGGLLIFLLAWIDIKGRHRWVPPFIVFLLTVRYLVWRITDSLPPVDETLNFVAGVIFLSVELLAVVGSLLTLIALSRYSNRTPEVDKRLATYKGQKESPLVDVFICTYNEEEQILERTIAGALAMNYDNYRVWVLDDGRRPWLEELAGTLGCHYLTRPDNSHAKAGNINHALQHLETLERKPDFVSILDADFVPTKVFLARTTTLLEEADVGIVQTPQHFVNADPIQANLVASDVWPDEQRFFFDILMPSKDAWGTAFCCGTSSVIRFEALREAGGFPTSSVTEDYLLTLRLKQYGYRTVYLNERLSMGLAPEGLGEYITQRSRWCLGFIQILRSKDGPFYKNRLAFLDRVSLIETFLYWSGTYAFRLAGLLVPIAYFLLGVRAVDVELGSGLANFLPYFIGQTVVIGWLSGWRILPIITDVTQLLATKEILMSVVIGLMKPKGHKFKVTAKGGDRTKTVVQWQMIWFFAAFLFATLLGLLVSFHIDTNRTLEDSSIIGLFWCWYNILLLLIAMVCCVEKPRHRRSERLRASGQIELGVGKKWVKVDLMDISVFGMRLRSDLDIPVRTRVEIDYKGQDLIGTVVRKFDGQFAVELEHTLGSRIFMIREVHSGQFGALFDSVRPSTLGKRIFRQLMD